MELPNQGHFFNGDHLEKRFTPAGPDHAQVAACAGMADYMDALSQHHGGGTGAEGARVAHNLMRQAEVELLQPLLDCVSSKNSTRVIGPTDATHRAPTVALQIQSNPEEMAAKLAKHGIMAGGGDFYAVRPLEAMGLDPTTGVLRLSFTHYTSKAEVDQLMAALDQEL